MSDVSTRPYEVALPGRAALAALAAGAGAIHLAMAPAHAAESMAEGIAFGLAGWAQVLLAVAVVARPRRGVLIAGAALSAAFVGAWALRGDLDQVAGTCVALEVLFALGAGLLAWKPALGAARAPTGEPAGPRWGVVALGAAVAAPVAVVALTTAAVASPAAQHHSHDHDDTAMDHDAMDHGHGTHGDDHGAPSPVAATGDDRGFAALANGHQHEHGTAVLDPKTQAELDRQLAITRELAVAYPTVKDAEAAGYHRAGPYAPGLGTHYLGKGAQVSGPITDDEVRRPILIYNGTQPDSPIVGFMYIGAPGGTAPEGFAGPNDHWHYHNNVCIKTGADGQIDTPFGADAEVSEDTCTKVGGKMLTNTGYMVHVWSVPGWDNPIGGVFGELNPRLTCADGTYHTIELDKIGSNRTICRDAAVAAP